MVTLQKTFTSSTDDDRLVMELAAHAACLNDLLERVPAEVRKQISELVIADFYVGPDPARAAAMRLLLDEARRPPPSTQMPAAPGLQ